ncbi:MAG TPA: hypothetical protein VFN71_13205 [Methylomirabilota bacterium]|nr:hypothetical protein [Methylomirabilota bacterium]
MVAPAAAGRVSGSVEAGLFSPGERLGWEFRDRLASWRHFAEAPPPPLEPDPRLRGRLEQVSARRRGVALWAICAVAIGMPVLWYAGGTLLGGNQGRAANVFLAAVTGAALVAVLWAAIGRPVWLLHRERTAADALQMSLSLERERHEGALAAWARRRDAHHTAEWERVDRIPEWGAVRTAPGTRRIDVFGGSLSSWEGFLTTFGSSMLAEQAPVRVLDLSGAMVAAELCRLSGARGTAVDVQVLPEELASSDLLAGLEPGQMADLLVESMHGDRPDGHREARALDARVLGAICEALAPDVSLARLHEALLALLGEPGEPVHLSPEERHRVAARLFSAEYLRRAHERLQRLEVHLHALRGLGAKGARPPGDALLRCLMVGEGGQGFSAELFADLLVQWAIRGLRPSPADQAAPRVLIVAGADRLRRRHLELLSDLCELRDVRLVYLFRHLRDDAGHVLGSGGAVVFMRLGNHEEAERAARFIGYGHHFVLSQVTRGHGAGEQRGRTTSTETTRRTTRLPRQVLPITSRARSWGTTNEYAQATNWHYAATEQRVYEYAVEPTALQNLPDYALLVVQRGQEVPKPGARPLEGRPTLRVADCNPDLVSLPRVSMQPFGTGEATGETPLPRLQPP